MAAPPETRSPGRGAARPFAACCTRCVVLALIVAAGCVPVLTTRWTTCGCAASRAASTSCTQPAGFAIGESLLPFDSRRDLRQGVPGRAVEHAARRDRSASCWPRSSARWSASAGCRATSWCARCAARYVELFRNVPLLLQLFIWYFVLTELLPPIDEALQPLPGVFFSKNGLQFPIPVWATGHVWHGGRASSLGIVGGLVLGALGAAPLRGHRRAPPVFVLPALVTHRRLRVARLARRRRADGAGHSGEDRDHRGRRRRGDAGVPDGADRPDALHGELHRRDRARRHPGGALRPARGQRGARPNARAGNCGSCCCRRRCA